MDRMLDYPCAWVLGKGQMKKTFELYKVNVISFTSSICSFSFCISEDSPEKQNQYVDILYEEIIGIGSCGCGGCEAPQSAVCKLEKLVA